MKKAKNQNKDTKENILQNIYSPSKEKDSKTDIELIKATSKILSYVADHYYGTVDQNFTTNIREVINSTERFEISGQDTLKKLKHLQYGTDKKETIQQHYKDKYITNKYKEAYDIFASKASLEVDEKKFPLHVIDIVVKGKNTSHIQVIRIHTLSKGFNLDKDIELKKILTPESHIKYDVTPIYNKSLVYSTELAKEVATHAYNENQVFHIGYGVVCGVAAQTAEYSIDGTDHYHVGIQDNRNTAIVINSPCVEGSDKSDKVISAEEFETYFTSFQPQDQGKNYNKYIVNNPGNFNTKIKFDTKNTISTKSKSKSKVVKSKKVEYTIQDNNNENKDNVSKLKDNTNTKDSVNPMDYGITVEAWLYWSTKMHDIGRLEHISSKAYNFKKYSDKKATGYDAYTTYNHFWQSAIGKDFPKEKLLSVLDIAKDFKFNDNVNFKSLKENPDYKPVKMPNEYLGQTGNQEIQIRLANQGVNGVQEVFSSTSKIDQEQSIYNGHIRLTNSTEILVKFSITTSDEGNEVITLLENCVKEELPSYSKETKAKIEEHIQLLPKIDALLEDRQDTDYKVVYPNEGTEQEGTNLVLLESIKNPSKHVLLMSDIKNVQGDEEEDEDIEEETPIFKNGLEKCNSFYEEKHDELLPIFKSAKTAKQHIKDTKNKTLYIVGSGLSAALGLELFLELKTLYANAYLDTLNSPIISQYVERKYREKTEEITESNKTEEQKKDSLFALEHSLKNISHWTVSPNYYNTSISESIENEEDVDDGENNNDNANKFSYVYLIKGWYNNELKQELARESNTSVEKFKDVSLQMNDTENMYKLLLEGNDVQVVLYKNWASTPQAYKNYVSSTNPLWENAINTFFVENNIPKEHQEPFIKFYKGKFLDSNLNVMYDFHILKQGNLQTAYEDYESSISLFSCFYPPKVTGDVTKYGPKNKEESAELKDIANANYQYSTLEIDISQHQTVLDDIHNTYHVQTEILGADYEITSNNSTEFDV